MPRRTGNVWRTTISVPADLKERMGQVREQVNWSALAAVAFEKKLAEIAGREEGYATSHERLIFLFRQIEYLAQEGQFDQIEALAKQAR